MAIMTTDVMAPARTIRADRLGLDAAFDSVEALVADPDIDVVHVCTPNVTHAAIARAAIVAGKHVICEKPLATSSACGNWEEVVA